MTDHTEERILLAEAMGWTRMDKDKWLEYGVDPRVAEDGWLPPEGERMRPYGLVPDPYTNPADTEAVMDWLESTSDFQMGRSNKKSYATAYLNGSDFSSDLHRDWKHAVTEVAVKVAREINPAK